MNKKFFAISSLLAMLSLPAFALEGNNLRTLFLNNQTNICAINLRTFNAKDTNGDGIINEDEVSGNFINAVDRLDELKNLGINTLHVLPITPVGKLKALGTAGSLYAISDFESLNPQLADTKSDLSLREQAKYFIEECHKRGIRVIVDLPSCGSYDLFLTHPELFLKDEKQCSIVPSDWTDVRLLNAGNNDKLNQDVMNAHKKFVDLMIEIGADGIRADVATIKPYEFWVELIKYAREKDAEFMFLAEASDSWREPPSKYAEFTPYDKLLEAGFDGYYGSFFNLKEWNADDFIEHIKFNRKLLSSYPDKKSVIMSFVTHDEVSPIILHGAQYSKMIIWLETLLPFNRYYIDGFFSGDDYIYPWENAQAPKSETDDDFYFVHRGKLDIFNFSRMPKGNHADILENVKLANQFRKDNEQLLLQGGFNTLKTNNNNVFAFSRTFNNETVVVIGNLNFKDEVSKVEVKIPKMRRTTKIVDVTGGTLKKSRNTVTISLDKGQIKIFKYRN